MAGDELELSRRYAGDGRRWQEMAGDGGTVPVLTMAILWPACYQWLYLLWLYGLWPCSPRLYLLWLYLL